MNIGQVISLVGHTGLIGVLLFGGVWNSEPLPFEVADVAVISEEEFQAAMRAAEALEASVEVETPAAPAEEPAPEAVRPEPELEPEPQPEPVTQPEPEPLPEVETELPAEAEVADVPPELAPPVEDFAALVPGRSLRPKLKPLERVAPEPAAQPNAPDAAPAEETVEETRPDPDAETVAEESEAQQPEEATTEINPEAADDETLAPKRSLRPKTRPRQRVVETEPADTSGAVTDALTEALGEEPAAPSGPPLTSGEKKGLRLAVSRCWNVGALSTDALQVTVYVSFELTREGKPVTSSVKMIRAEGGLGDAAKRAYEAARRAIIRCGAQGYDLPDEKYDQWKEVEIKFNPESMR